MFHENFSSESVALPPSPARAKRQSLQPSLPHISTHGTTTGAIPRSTGDPSGLYRPVTGTTSPVMKVARKPVRASSGESNGSGSDRSPAPSPTLYSSSTSGYPSQATVSDGFNRTIQSPQPGHQSTQYSDNMDQVHSHPSKNQGEHVNFLGLDNSHAIGHAHGSTHGNAHGNSHDHGQASKSIAHCHHSHYSQHSQHTHQHQSHHHHHHHAHPQRQRSHSQSHPQTYFSSEHLEQSGNLGLHSTSNTSTEQQPTHRSFKHIIRHAYSHSLSNPLFPNLQYPTKPLQTDSSRSPSPEVVVSAEPPVLEMKSLAVKPIATDMAKAGYPVYSVPRKPVGSSSSLASIASSQASNGSPSVVTHSVIAANSPSAVSPEPIIKSPGLTQKSIPDTPPKGPVDLARSSARARSRSPGKRGLRSGSPGKLSSDLNTTLDATSNSPTFLSPRGLSPNPAENSSRVSTSSCQTVGIPDDTHQSPIRDMNSPASKEKVPNFSHKDAPRISRDCSPNPDTESSLHNLSPVSRPLRYSGDEETFTFLQESNTTKNQQQVPTPVTASERNRSHSPSTGTMDKKIASPIRVGRRGLTPPISSPPLLSPPKSSPPMVSSQDSSSPRWSAQPFSGYQPAEYPSDSYGYSQHSPILTSQISSNSQAPPVRKSVGSSRPLSLQVTSADLGRVNFETDEFDGDEESDPFPVSSAQHLKYHILKYSKDLYLTTNPDSQHLDMRVGPSYYVDITTSNGDFELNFHQNGNLALTIARKRRGPAPFQMTVFSDVYRPLSFDIHDASEMIYSPNSTNPKGIRCEQYLFVDTDKREWLIGNRHHLTKGDLVKVSKSKVFFSLKADPNVILGMVRRRIPIKKRVMQLGKKDADKEEDDDADEEKIGWLYAYDRAQEHPYPQYMMKAVIGLSMAVSYCQRLDSKRSFRASLNLDKLQSVGKLSK
ncbi:hypothetical protein AWJ20_622 [Sugiyamaella lignohabitans]|uniref:Uncharacterized protein n=1 Tax=Sugiyamaella lignohabitans TaxID=796027 RepID=A0A167D1M3_9ASCO|nr:uncharacterized protein AWJ20_622 [Sugiyamaella lignohabitans]ANB12371.1 hypothetical protein AWJ20_622 [Sugiyamaella lignohabitans]